MKMQLVKNWDKIVKRSHSMWAFYLSLICLLLPDAIYVAFEWDTNPRFWFWLAVVLLIYGIIGRIKDQEISQ